MPPVAEPPRPSTMISLSYNGLLNTSLNLDIFTVFTFGLSQGFRSFTLYDIFVPQKVLLLKNFDDVIACDLRFAPPPIKNPGYAYDWQCGGMKTSHQVKNEIWHFLFKFFFLDIGLSWYVKHQQYCECTC